jgi:putative phage-type endonuclease
MQILELEQRSDEWFKMRKTHITATDAPIIMGENPWKTELQLYEEKVSDDVKPLYMNDAMKRGMELEPIALDLFNLKTGFDMKPVVLSNGWQMASLDGRDAGRSAILEIKCPSLEKYEMMKMGIIPDYYKAQLQHQINLAQVDFVYFFAFYEMDGTILKVMKDDNYIKEMNKREMIFFDRIMKKDPPEPSDRDYIVNESKEWKSFAESYRINADLIKFYESEQDSLRNKIISLTEDKNTMGAGIKITKTIRRGNIDYGKIVALKDLDLEPYRKPNTKSWRININGN